MKIQTETMKRREEKTPVMTLVGDQWIHGSHIVSLDPFKVYTLISEVGADDETYTWYMNGRAEPKSYEDCHGGVIKDGKLFYTMSGMETGWGIYFGKEVVTGYKNITHTQLIGEKIASIVYDEEMRPGVYFDGKEFYEKGTEKVDFLTSWRGIPIWGLKKDGRWFLKSPDTRRKFPDLGQYELHGIAISGKNIFPYVSHDEKHFVAGADFPMFDDIIGTSITIQGKPLYVGIIVRSHQKIELQVMVGKEPIKKFINVRIPIVSAHDNQPLLGVVYKNHGVEILYKDKSWRYPDAEDISNIYTMNDGRPLGELEIRYRLMNKRQVVLGEEIVEDSCAGLDDFSAHGKKIIWTTRKEKENEDDDDDDGLPFYMHEKRKVYYSNNSGKSFFSFSKAGGIYGIELCGQHFSYFYLADRKELSVMTVRTK